MLVQPSLLLIAVAHLRLLPSGLHVLDHRLDVALQFGVGSRHSESESFFVFFDCPLHSRV